MAKPRRHDWAVIGTHEPYYGVLTAPESRAAAMDADARVRFYASGRDQVAEITAFATADCGVRPGGRALDIGCGVGRLTHAMAPLCDAVVGYDVAEPMLAIARAGPPEGPAANVRFVSALPDGPFDWINSFIVLQHIPPPEGMALLDACLARAAPGALATIQTTLWRDPHLSPPSRLGGRVAGALHRWRAKQSGGDVELLIQMHDYDMSALARVFSTHGFDRLCLRHTDHGGHHGVWIIARKA
ncbi:MAG: methyltransferase domain-containing protein [Alphaproteobacteria bacterium]|nr:methyltransferase domain-containing protein [Alphaproteobacteria bacterium]